MWLLMALCLFLPQNQNVDLTVDKQAKAGFFDLYWDQSSGQLLLAIEKFDDPFLFVHSLPKGLGSNDIGLDRGQLGRSRIVHFERVGDKVFLVERNLSYRANSTNPAERQAVADSFAYSTLWGTTIVGEDDGVVFVDLASFIMRDEHGVAERIKQRGEGTYRLEPTRSRYVPAMIKSFPDNTEIEVALTFLGEPAGKRYINDVAPTPEAITLHQRYSLIRLPEPGFEPRPFHPKSGYFYLTHYDYAAPLDASLNQQWIPRHRLERQNPNAARSELVEPLVYYVDRGAPDKIKQALIEGAQWWNQAFEAAGIVNGFKVLEAPADLDPMDVRYNVIQWVHRSTRGWSYGGSVIDPRTGEIIKGHVTLGSLRVRQDRLIFEGMIPRDGDGNFLGPEPVELALARIRQLSAHEVGHTLGLGHNFGASANNRASVMDYPAMLVTLENDKLDFSQVYDVGIGEWDKLAIRYGYAHFDDLEAGLKSVIEAFEKQGLVYLADVDGRSASTMHPWASVWENNSNDPVLELARLIALRAHLLANFGTQNLAPHAAISQLEEVLVPVYLTHRFQLAAAAKPLGGAYFEYDTNDGPGSYRVVPPEEQSAALAILLQTVSPAFLDLPASLRDLIPPRAQGHERSRESFARRTWPAFDELSLPETAAQMTLDVILNTNRLNRLYNQQVNNPEQMGIEGLLDTLLGHTLLAEPSSGREGVLHRMVNYQVADALIAAVGDTDLRQDVRAQVLAQLADAAETLSAIETEDGAYAAHYAWLTHQLENIGEADERYKPSSTLPPPPGSPIGGGSQP